MSNNNGTTFTFKNAVAKSISLSLIRENAQALRPVDKTTLEYKELVDSIVKHGVMNPISVREVKDPNTGAIFYGLVDGLHRYNGAMDAGLTEINAQVGDVDEANLLEAQIIGNLHKVETKAIQFSK